MLLDHKFSSSINYNTGMLQASATKRYNTEIIIILLLFILKVLDYLVFRVVDYTGT